MEVVELHARLISALKRGDHEAFVALFHPEVEMRTVSHSGEIFAGRDGVRSWWQIIRSAAVHEPSVSETQTLSDRALYVRGRLQTSVPGGGIRDVPAAWVVVSSDGLVWRYQPVAGRAEALAYARRVGAAGRRPRDMEGFSEV
jgi:hypothetical protein